MTRVGLLFPGEMGAAVGAAAHAEVLWASEGRSKETAARAAQAGLRDVGFLRALARESEIVLSVCPPESPKRLRAAWPQLGFKGLYVEANAIAPARAERIASETGLRVVDGGILAETAINLYLSGDEHDVQTVAALFRRLRRRADPLPGGVGAASALKMAFGGWNKIGVLLAAQAHAIAGAYGVREQLAAEEMGTEGIVRARPQGVALGRGDGGDRRGVRRPGPL